MTYHRLTSFCLATALAMTAAGQSFAASMPRRQAIGAAAASTGTANEPPRPTLGPPSVSELQSYGCLATGIPMMGVAAFAGDTELLLLFTGGTVVPTAPLALGMAVAGTVFASFCAIGALATPGVVRMWHMYYDEEEVKP